MKTTERSHNKVESIMENPQFPADLVTFTEENFNRRDL